MRAPCCLVPIKQIEAEEGSVAVQDEPAAVGGTWVPGRGMQRQGACRGIVLGGKGLEKARGARSERSKHFHRYFCTIWRTPAHLSCLAARSLVSRTGE